MEKHQYRVVVSIQDDFHPKKELCEVAFPAHSNLKSAKEELEKLYRFGAQEITNVSLLEVLEEVHDKIRSRYRGDRTIEDICNRVEFALTKVRDGSVSKMIH